MRTIILVAACLFAGLAALCVWLPDTPKFEAAIYCLAVGVVAAAVAQRAPE